jgi:hypothetical protein
VLLRKVAKDCAVAAGFPLAYALAGRPAEKISAVMRIKNEIEFLEQSIKSLSISWTNWSSSTIAARTGLPM